VRPAVYLDRDGTLIEFVHYLRDPSEVRVVAGGAEAVNRLQAAGFACVVVTNQSVIGRGLLTEVGLAEVHEEMHRQLAEAGVTLDGVYFCPTAPGTSDRTVVEHPDRKPGPGMLRRAARELGLDLGRSWMVGDALSDMHAGRNAGCRGTVLVRTGHGESVEADDPSVDWVVPDLPAAVRLILEQVAAESAS
jgi:D-glycero-D-manno-heptose 1,7-bisphosphate phosphatase